MSDVITRKYGTEAFANLEAEWIQAKADADEAKEYLADVEARMRTEIKRRGDTPDEDNPRTDIVGKFLKIIFRYNAGQERLDSTRLKQERPDIAAEYTKTSRPSMSFRPSVKSTAAAQRVA